MQFRNACAIASTVVLATSLAACTAPPLAPAPVVTQGAPSAAGPYSQGIVAGNMVFTAGFTPRDPKTNAMVQGDITVQANRVFDSIEAVLKAAGASWADVVKVTVYMTNLNDFAKMNEVMAARFGSAKPARTTIGVAALPNGAPIEVDMVAIKPSGR